MADTNAQARAEQAHCPKDYDPVTWQARVDLAATYRLMNNMDHNEGVCNHNTTLVPGTTDKFLCIPYGLAWSEVTASNLLMVDSNGKVLEGEGVIDDTAFFIHSQIHLADTENNVCVLHSHMPHATALCCVRGMELKMIHQNCLRFHNNIAYDHVYNGLVLDDREGDRIAKMMGDKRVYFHQSHGVIVVGGSAAEAWDDLYYLERACQVQLLAMGTGNDLVYIRDDVAAKFKADCDKDKATWAKCHFMAMKRELVKKGQGEFTA